jgi:hypothetical protein
MNTYNPQGFAKQHFLHPIAMRINISVRPRLVYLHAIKNLGIKHDSFKASNRQQNAPELSPRTPKSIPRIHVISLRLIER